MKTALLFLIFVSAAHAEEWKPADKLMLGAAVSLLVVDWGQTRSITDESACEPRPGESEGTFRVTAVYQRECRRYHEKNPFLGSNPSSGDVDKYFALAILGTVGISYALPQKWRRYFLGGVIVLESLIVIHNHQIGLRAEF